MVFSPSVIHVFTADASNVSWDQAVNLNRVIFPYLFFVALAALAMGILNCFHSVGLPAATSVLLNLAVVLFSTGLFWGSFRDAAASLGGGGFGGGRVRFVVRGASL